MQKRNFRLQDNWQYIVLAAILILGFYLRAYHLDYPLIDYHNMKEAHTLMEVRHFQSDGFSENRLDYESTLENPGGVHSDNFPLMGWFIALVWNIIGENIVFARLLVIMLTLGTILLVYLSASVLFKRIDMALLSAFFTAVMPLSIYFGRRVFYDVPALFFAMLGVYYFLRWVKKPLLKYFIWFVVGISLGALSKVVYLILLLPIAAIFPYKRIIEKKYWKQLALSLIIPSSIVLYTLVSKNPYSGGVLSRISNPEQIAEFFTAGYWMQIYQYAVVDNYARIGFSLMLIGLIISLFYLKKRENRFMAAGIFSIIPYSFIIGPMLRGHNYYQYPFIPFVAMLISYTLVFFARSIMSETKPKLTDTLLLAVGLPLGLVIINGIMIIIYRIFGGTFKFYLAGIIYLSLLIIALRYSAGYLSKYRDLELYIGVAVFFMLFMFGPFRLSTDRQFDTQFWGLDLAGNYIREHAQPGERVFGSGHQDTAMYWYANTSGLKLPTDLTTMTKMEDKLNYRWLFLYQWGLGQAQSSPDIWNHILSSYHLKQVGLINNNNQPQLIYLILEKGGSFNMSELNTLQGTPVTHAYDTTNSKINFVTVDV